MKKKGEIIRKYRLKSKLTQEELSKILQISSNHLSLIENNKKGISKKLANKIIKYFNLPTEDKNIILEDIGVRITKDYIENLREKQKELQIKELEIINTYDFIRDNHFTLSKIASINNLLKTYFSKTEEIIVELEFKLCNEDEEFLRQIRPALKTTIKRSLNKIQELETYLHMQAEVSFQNRSGGNMDRNLNNSLDSILELIPKEKLLHVLTTQQKRMAILTYVAENLKLKWKEYNVPGCPTGYSFRLWDKGRGTIEKKGYMENRIESYLALQLEGADTPNEYQELLDDIVDNIIKHSMIIVEDALRAARHAKTEAVREKYLKSMSNQKFLLAALQIGIVLYASTLIEKGVDIRHEYLSLRLEAMKKNKYKLEKAWKKFNASDQTDADYIELEKVLQEIFKEFEEKREMNEQQLDSIVQEKLMLKIIGTKTLEKYMGNMMDEICQRITGQIRLFKLNGDI